MIWALIIFVLSLTLKLAIDLKRWQSKGTTHHGIEAIFVLFALVGCSWLSGFIWFPGWCFTWNALFDTLWGLLAVRQPFYLGTTAWLDRLQRKYRVLQVLKYLLAITSIILYVTHS